jgi:hypothetical protein
LEHLWVAEVCCSYLIAEIMGVKELVKFPRDVTEEFEEFLCDLIALIIHPCLK